MKLGVLTVALGDMSLDAACKFLSEQGVQMVEIGCGGFPGTAHCNAAELLADENKQKEFLDTIHKYGLEISALSAHGNAVHPDKCDPVGRKAWCSGCKYVFRLPWRISGGQDSQLGYLSLAG